MVGRFARSVKWPVLAAGGSALGIWLAFATHHGTLRDPRTAVLGIAAVCGGMVVLVWIVQAAERARGRREWRESAGRSRNQRRAASAIIVRDGEDYTGLRDDVDRVRDELAAVRATADAAATIISRACRLEGTAPPAALQAAEETAPLPRVRLAARDGRRVG